MYTTVMVTDAPTTARRFESSAIVIDWSKERMHKRHTSSDLLSWVRAVPDHEDVHVYLGNVHFTGQRVLMRQLQALGCTVTSRQYQGN